MQTESCPYCGVANPAGQKFCGECGGALPQPAPPPSDPGTARQEPSPRRTRRSFNATLALVLGFILILALIAAAAVVVRSTVRHGGASAPAKSWVTVATVQILDYTKVSSAIVTSNTSPVFSLSGGGTRFVYTIGGSSPKIYMYLVPAGKTWHDTGSVNADMSAQFELGRITPGQYYLEVREGFPDTTNYTVQVQDFK